MELDGDYWHANPKFYKGDTRIAGTTTKEIWEYDAYVTRSLSAKGYKVIRIWESDMKGFLAMLNDRNLLL